MLPCGCWGDEIVLLLVGYIEEMELLFFLSALWSSLCVSEFEFELRQVDYFCDHGMLPVITL